MADRPRARMSRADRREQLLDLGVDAVTGSSFDAVSVEQVAEAAGISRGLLFHYFPTRRDFLVAIAERGAQELLDVTEPDPSLPPLERLRASLASFVDYVTERHTAYVSLVRGAAGDPAMAEVVTRTRARIVDRVLEGFGLASPPSAVRVAVHGWVGFIEEATISWLAQGEARTSREELLALCESTLVHALAASTGADPVELAGA